MGIYDRDYTREDFSGGTGMRMMMPPLTPVVKWLLMINIGIFIVEMVVFGGGRTINIIEQVFAVYPDTVGKSLQIWRLITYQFLHSTAGIWHIFGNMITLFFFGPVLEGSWGSRRFLRFYLTCGAAGGILYTILVWVGFLPAGYLLGASGAILGILAAAAILFPKMRVFVFGIFPLPLYILAIILAFWSIMGLFGDTNQGGEAAHLAGMATGALYVLWQPWIRGTRLSARKGNWAKKMERERKFQADVDRILAKVHESGIKSLTFREKRVLREATQREQR